MEKVVLIVLLCTPLLCTGTTARYKGLPSLLDFLYDAPNDFTPIDAQRYPRWDRSVPISTLLLLEAGPDIQGLPERAEQTLGDNTMKVRDDTLNPAAVRGSDTMNSRYPWLRPYSLDADQEKQNRKTTRRPFHKRAGNLRYSEYPVNHGDVVVEYMDDPEISISPYPLVPDSSDRDLKSSDEGVAGAAAPTRYSGGSVTEYRNDNRGQESAEADEDDKETALDTQRKARLHKISVWLQSLNNDIEEKIAEFQEANDEELQSCQQRLTDLKLRVADTETSERNALENQERALRRREHVMACETKLAAVQLNESYNERGEPVQVLHGLEYNGDPSSRQFVFVHECARRCSQCRDALGNSRCELQYSQSHLYYRPLLLQGTRLGRGRWGLVQVPSHCACVLLPAHSPPCLH